MSLRINLDHIAGAGQHSHGALAGKNYFAGGKLVNFMKCGEWGCC